MARRTAATTPIRMAEDVVPVAELKADVSGLVRSLRTRPRTVVVTENGRPAAVLLAPEEFDRLSSRERFLTAVRDGLDDVDAGRVIGDQELGRLLDARFGVSTPRPRRR